MKTQPLIIILSALVAGCANTHGAKLPHATGPEIRINSPAEIQELLRESAEPAVLIGPKASEKETIERFMDKPMLLLSREPDESDFVRLGAALVKTTVIVTFPDGGTEFKPSGSERFHIRQLAARASRVEIRGRTSKETCTAGSEWLASERARAAKRHLLDLNIPGIDISLNSMCADGFIANSQTKAGRAKNRRVELQFFFEGGTA